MTKNGPLDGLDKVTPDKATLLCCANPYPVLGDDSGQEDETSEMDWIKPEEIARLYSVVKKVPPQMVAMFGSVETRELMVTMNDPALQEQDSLLSKRELTEEESVEYAAVLPEYHAIRTRLNNLARRCVANIVAKNIVKTALNKSVSSHRKKPGMFFVGRALGTDVFAKLDALAESFMFTEGFSNRNVQAEYLKIKLHEYAIQAVFKLLSGGGYPMQDRSEIQAYLCDVDDANTRDGKGRIYARAFFDMIDHFEKVVRHSRKDLFKEMTTSLEATLPDKAVSDEDLAVGNSAKFEEIKDFIEIEKPGLLRRHIGQSKMLIAGKRYVKVDGFRFNSSCIVRLLLGPGAKYVTPRLTVNDVGNHNMEHSLWHDSVELYLDRFSGELCYCLTNLPIRPSLKKRDYLLIQGAVFDLLSDHFNGRAITPIQSVIKDTRECLANGTGSSSDNAAADSTLSAAGEEKSDTGDSAVADEGTGKTFEIFRRMRGIKGNRVFTALTGLLDKPVRINGSHHIFRGRNGKTYPIALHGDDQVGLGLLKKCLKMWELPPEDFLAMIKA